MENHMAKNQAKNQAAPAASGAAKKKINRVRRNAATRKCLPKALKIQFAKCTRAEFRSLLKAWQESRKRTPVTSERTEARGAALQSDLV